MTENMATDNGGEEHQKKGSEGGEAKAEGGGLPSEGTPDVDTLIAAAMKGNRMLPPARPDGTPREEEDETGGEDGRREELLPQLDQEGDEIRKKQELIENLKDENITDQDRVKLLNDSGTPKEAAPLILGEAGMAEDKINDFVRDHENELIHQLTPEDIDNAINLDEARAAVEMEMEPGSELMETQARIDSGEASPDEVYSVIKNAKERTGLNKRLFDDETGLLRKEDWFKRLVAKPAGAGALAALLTYLLLLNSMTKWAVGRVK